MPIPDFTDHGLLPAGYHPCTLDEAQSRFCWNDHREALWTQSLEFVEYCSSLGLEAPIFVDGSFVTNKPYPRDIDIVADLTHATNEEIGLALQLHFTQQQFIKDRYRVDFWVFHPMASKDLTQFFQYIREEDAQARGCGPDIRKGLLSIAL